MPVFTDIPHDQVLADVATLAARIAADPWRPDFLVGIGRGGLVPAVYLSHATGLPMLSIDYSGGSPDFADAPLARLAARSQAGERLLLVDDINDSGRTIAALRDTLSAVRGIAANIRFLTLIDNVGSAARVDYAARTIDRATVKDWFVFPWEAVAPHDAVARDAAAIPDRIG